MPTALITGAANGIGAQTATHFFSLGYNVVIADLPFTRPTAEALIASLPTPSLSSTTPRTLFIPTNILIWTDMTSLYRKIIEEFGQIDVVIANAGMMESRDFWDLDADLDESGELKESLEAWRVIDVNLKGTMNTLRLALHHMRTNPIAADGSRGSIVLIASTSGYFGGTSVVSYVASKHGVVGLFRASLRAAEHYGVRLNVVAPFFTPTHITGGYAEKWKERGLPANTVEGVAAAILGTVVDGGKRGECVLVAGAQTKEIEKARTAMVREWVGEETATLMAEGGKFFDELGGYPLPKARE